MLVICLEKARVGWAGNTKPLSPFTFKRKTLFLLLGCCQSYFYQVNYRGQQTCAVKNLTSQNVSHDIWATKDTQPSTAGFPQQLSCQPWMPLAVCPYRLGAQRARHALGLNKPQKDQASTTADTNKNVIRGGL